MPMAKIIKLSEYSLRNAAKDELISMVLSLREELTLLKTESEIKIASLQEKLNTAESTLNKLQQADINKTVNQPSSKQPEFNKKTGPKKKTRKKRHNGRAGAGNRSKPEPDIINNNPLNYCPNCQEDLTEQSVIDNPSRIVEDIPEIPEKTIIAKEVQERKWCSTCVKVVSSVSEAALPQSDIGLRSLCLVAYLWVVSAISMPGIVAFLNSFFRLRLSTSGVSKMMIRLAEILLPVYD
jgi:hypothetical protein